MRGGMPPRWSRLALAAAFVCCVSQQERTAVAQEAAESCDVSACSCDKAPRRGGPNASNPLYDVHSGSDGEFSYLFSVCSHGDDVPRASVPEVPACHPEAVAGPFVLTYRTTDSSDCQQIPQRDRCATNGSSACGSVHTRIRHRMNVDAYTHSWGITTHKYTFGCALPSAPPSGAVGGNISGLIGQCRYQISWSKANASTTQASPAGPVCTHNTGSSFRSAVAVGPPHHLCTCACGSSTHCTLSAAFAICDLNGDGKVLVAVGETVILLTLSLHCY